jgi:hypothetical protein
MDIVGRTRSNIYDETGLVGIWPLDIGVSAFAGASRHTFVVIVMKMFFFPILTVRTSYSDSLQA